MGALLVQKQLVGPRWSRLGFITNKDYCQANGKLYTNLETHKIFGTPLNRFPNEFGVHSGKYGSIRCRLATVDWPNFNHEVFVCKYKAVGVFGNYSTGNSNTVKTLKSVQLVWKLPLHIQVVLHVLNCLECLLH